MPGPSQFSTPNIFVLRIWQEKSMTGTNLRGYIQHVQSGKQGVFSEINGLLDYLHEFRIIPDSVEWKAQGCEFSTKGD